MTWGRPDLLYGLWAAPLLLLFLWGALRSRGRALERLGQLAASRVSERALRVHRLRAAAVLLSLALGLVALAQPRWGYRWQELKREGLSIVVVLDVSRSMDATDVSPSRMERAQRKVLDLADLLEGDKVGLVLFAGGAYPRMPLTLDYDALRQIVRDSGTSALRAQGSDIGAAIDQAVALLGPQGTADRAILLVSDGEDQVGEAEAAAQRAAEAGVHLYALGVGTSDGAPIPLEEGGFKKDKSGSVVLTRLEEDGLKRLAEIGAGAYVRASAGGGDVRALYADEIRGKLVSAELGARQEKIWDERFQWPLAAALALMVLASALRPGRLRLPGVGAGLLLAALLAGGPARAADPAAPASGEVARLQAEQTAHPGDLGVAERLGKALFDAGDFRQAEDVLNAVAERSADPAQRQRARANAALSAYRGGRLQQALEGYQAVLKENPQHAAAGQNSAAVQKEIALRLQQQPPEQQPQQGDSDPSQSQDQGQNPSEDQQQDDTGQQDPSQDQSQDQNQNQNQNQDQSAQPRDGQDSKQPQAAAPESDGSREQRDDTGGEQGSSAEQAEDGQDTGSSPGEPDGDPDEQRPGAISEQEADRLLDGVEEGEPRVIVNPRSRGGKDW